MKALLCVVAAFLCSVAGLAVATNAQPGGGSSEQPGSNPPAVDLAGPSELSCGSGTGSFALSWTSVEGAAKYQVLISNVPIEETADTSLGLGWLPAKTRFEFGVRAGDGNGWGTTTTKVCATTSIGNDVSGQADLVDPPPLRTFFCTASTKNSITASWEAVAGASSYKLIASKRISPTTGELVATVNTSDTSATLTGLELLTTYTVAVSSINSENQEGLGIGIICSTTAARPDCDTASHNSIRIRWETRANISDTVYQWYAARATTGNSYTDGRALSPTTTTTTFTGLQPSTTYTLRLWWKASEFGQWIEVSPDNRRQCPTGPRPPTQLPSPPPPPSGLECSDESTSGFTLDWDQVSGASKYQVLIDDEDGWLPSGQTASHPFSGLDAGEDYPVQVQAGNSGGWSPSATETCHTKTDAPVVTCSAATASGFTANWVAVNGADEYQTRIGDDGEWDDTTATSRPFTGLASGEDHAVQVQALNGDVWSASGTKTCHTQTDTPVVTCSAATASGFTANWVAVNGADEYQTRIGDDGEWEDTTATSRPFTGLASGGDYAVQVQAQNGDVWSDTGTKTCHTKTDAPVVSCVDGSATTSGFDVSWAAVTGADEYQTRIAGNEEWEDTTATSYSFTGLASGGEFSVQVQAQNGDVWSDTGTKTCHTLPDAPEGLECLGESSSGFAVSWDEAVGADRYRVRVGDRNWVRAAGDDYLARRLTADTEYSVRVQAGSRRGWGGTASVSCRTLVGAPQALTCRAGYTSALVSWEAGNGADRYRARINGWEWHRADRDDFLALGLEANTDHLIEVQAGNERAWGEIASVACRTGLVAPEPVTCSTGSSSALVGWNPVEGATTYRARTKGGKWSLTANTPHTLTGLAPDTAHTIEVQAGDQTGWSDTATASCRTKTAPPHNPECDAASNTTTTVSWDPADGAAIYRIAQQPQNDDTEPQWAQTTQTNHTLAGLAHNTTYLIQAGNKHGWSDTTQCTFTAPPPDCSTTTTGFLFIWPEKSRQYHWTLTLPDPHHTQNINPGRAIYSFSNNKIQPNTAYTFTLDWWHTRTGPPAGTHTLTCTTQPLT